MDEMPSSEFRRQYARLTAPTLVTVNGHPIGVWTPAVGMAGEITASHTGPQGERVIDGMKLSSASISQAQRDELLRKINRGK